jgi:hypothetical protein
MVAFVAALSSDESHTLTANFVPAPSSVFYFSLKLMDYFEQF